MGITGLMSPQFLLNILSSPSLPHSQIHRRADPTREMLSTRSCGWQHPSWWYHPSTSSTTCYSTCWAHCKVLSAPSQCIYVSLWHSSLQTRRAVVCFREQGKDGEVWVLQLCPGENRSSNSQSQSISQRGDWGNHKGLYFYRPLPPTFTITSPS